MNGWRELKPRSRQHSAAINTPTSVSCLFFHVPIPACAGEPGLDTPPPPMSVLDGSGLLLQTSHTLQVLCTLLDGDPGEPAQREGTGQSVGFLRNSSKNAKHFQEKRGTKPGSSVFSSGIKQVSRERAHQLALSLDWEQPWFVTFVVYLNVTSRPDSQQPSVVLDAVQQKTVTGPQISVCSLTLYMETKEERRGFPAQNLPPSCMFQHLKCLKLVKNLQMC